jgi:hypothetical protein
MGGSSPAVTGAYRNCVQEPCHVLAKGGGAHAPRDRGRCRSCDRIRGAAADEHRAPVSPRHLSGSCEDPAPRRTPMGVLASTAQADALATPRGMWSRAETEKERSKACRSPLDGGTVDQRAKRPPHWTRLWRHRFRYFILQLAESHLTLTLFWQILGRIERLAGHSRCSTTVHGERCRQR